MQSLGIAPDGSSAASWIVESTDDFRKRVQELVAQLEAGAHMLPRVMGEEPE